MPSWDRTGQAEPRDDDDVEALEVRRSWGSFVEFRRTPLSDVDEMMSHDDEDECDVWLFEHFASPWIPSVRVRAALLYRPFIDWGLPKPVAPSYQQVG